MALAGINYGILIPWPWLCIMPPFTIAHLHVIITQSLHVFHCLFCSRSRCQLDQKVTYFMKYNLTVHMLWHARNRAVRCVSYVRISLVNFIGSND